MVLLLLCSIEKGFWLALDHLLPSTIHTFDQFYWVACLLMMYEYYSWPPELRSWTSFVIIISSLIRGAFVPYVASSITAGDDDTDILLLVVLDFLLWLLAISVGAGVTIHWICRRYLAYRFSGRYLPCWLSAAVFCISWGSESVIMGLDYADDKRYGRSINRGKV